MKMISYGHYVAGWLDSSIHDFLSALSPTNAATKYALITCLDSNFDVASLRNRSPELKSIASKASVVGSGLLVPTDLMLEVDSKGKIFFGFDEVWFFPNKKITSKPRSVSIVGPARFDQPRLNKLGKWMSANGCSMGLGGGEGLNFVVRARGLVGYLIGHSIAQPQPSFGSFETADAR